MGAGAKAARPRWWQDLRWITALVVVAIVASLLWGLFGPEAGVVVSRETTFITEPLRADGLPDYRAHALDLMGRGTPPEENAAVDVLRATWPMELDAPHLAAVCGELGIPDTPPELAPLVGAEQDAELERRMNDFRASRDGPPEGAGDGPCIPPVAGRSIEGSQCEPWTAAECPPLADWVTRSSPALDVIVAGAARPRYEMPPAGLLTTPPVEPLLTANFTAVLTLRNVARALATRAMLHAGEGRHRDAWRDIHAIHRLARLLAPPDRGGFMVPYLISVAVGATANGLTIELLQAPGLTAEQIATIRRDLEALPPRAEAGAALVMERIGGLDVVMLLTRTRRNDLAGLVDVPVAHLRTSLDVNGALREFNAFYDRLDEVARMPDRGERKLMLDELEAGLLERLRIAGPRHVVAWWLRMATSRSARTADLAARMLCSLTPAVEALLDAGDRAGAEFDLLRVAAALAEYRARSLGGPDRAYPDRLEALVPTLLAEAPRDPFNGQALHYERRGDGYLLYAVGFNGIDDGGTSGDIVRGEWQPKDPTGAGQPYGLDTVIRMPTPRRGLLPRHQPPPP